MEQLEVYLDELEEAYETFYSKTVEAANYADAAGEYHGELFDTLGEEVFPSELFDLKELRDEAVEQARDRKADVDDQLFLLSGELQAFLDGRNGTPQRADEIDSRMGEIRDRYHELERELKIISGEKTPEDYVTGHDVQEGHLAAEALKNQISHIDAEGL
ncbi:hypothetical protein ACK3SF_01045 [Candidatus Nanosalina sp. VS9-1]|uniref:hypothetical protein n=1 Tax=Candidatus Nanosalina sp. VS9-1 TaxID=3388566 RepID=UPI0039E0FA69